LRPLRRTDEVVATTFDLPTGFLCEDCAIEVLVNAEP
jgi:hypothetical protein